MSVFWLRHPGLPLACHHILQSGIIPLVRRQGASPRNLHTLIRAANLSYVIGLPNKTNNNLCFCTIARLQCSSNVDRSSSSSQRKELNDSFLHEIGDPSLSLIEFEDLRVVLYPNQADVLTLSLSQATSVGAVFDLIRHPQLDAQQASQALVTLWDLQKLYCHFRTAYSHLSYNHYVEEYTDSISKHPQFPELVKNVLKHTPAYNEEALACVLLCLRRFGFNVWDVSVYPLVQAALKKLHNFPITALSRLCLAIRDQQGPGRMVVAAAVPRLIRYLDHCEDEESLKLITVGLLSTIHVCADDVLPKYLAVVQRMLSEGKLDQATPSSLIRILRFLSHCVWLGEVSETAARLLTICKPHISQCSHIEILWLSRVMETFQEPRDVAAKVEQVACRSLEGRSLKIQQLDLLACIVPSTSVEGRKRLEKVIVKIITEKSAEELKPHLASLHRILRGLKISQQQIIDTFWSKVVTCVEQDDSPESALFLARACHWYMYFNNNLGGTYRFASYERNIMSKIGKLTTEEMFIPRQTWCRLAAFVIAYSTRELPAWVLPRLWDLAPRFTVSECSIISRSLQIALGFHTRYLPLSLARPLVHLNHLLDTATANRLLNGNRQDAVALLRSYSIRRNRNTVTDVLLSTLYDQCVSNIRQYGLHSRTMKELVSVLATNNTLHAPMIDAMAEYVVKQRESIPVVLVERLVNLCYQLGYLPAAGDAFLAATADVLSEQYERVQGLGLVQSLLYLMLFQQLPESLVKIVFSIPFMDKLDEEVSCCYSKATYPFKVRHALMELNRAVCIDMPEADVPWFHDKFCQEQIISNPSRKTPFHTELEQCLQQILGGRKFLRSNGFSPYYHKLDFELLLNREGKPEEIPTHPSLFGPRFAQPVPETWEKIVVQVLPHEAYSNHTRSLGGSHKLHLRHLEILGYRVVPLPIYLWNSLPLSTMDAKMSYLRKQIFLRSTS